MNVRRLSKIIAAIQAQPMGAPGLTLAQISDITGLDGDRVNHAITSHMKAMAPRITVLARCPRSRYYASPAHLEAGQAALAVIDAASAADAKRRRAEASRNRAREKSAARSAAAAKRALKLPTNPKPPRQAVAGLLSRAPKPKAPRTVVATNPNNVKPVVVPGFTGVSRFAPAANCEGAGFMADWRAKRGAA